MRNNHKLKIVYTGLTFQLNHKTQTKFENFGIYLGANHVLRGFTVRNIRLLVLQASILCKSEWFHTEENYIYTCLSSNATLQLHIPLLRRAVALSDLEDPVCLELSSQFHHLMIHSLPIINRNWKGKLDIENVMLNQEKINDTKVVKKSNIMKIE